ncbi:hypothetical protein ALI144C_38600 [Actinosynnema sp. ALI-1.44]|uniref:hypothetical protein n=1 Tax=Actinosynnema sp. ALI-1.44 TaxID=1933779 RepID=UPI00097C0593|nr:hypothetical protein [Actinosynnema sp. ALI-1.44]ONI74727.1 hypothetical protein ALI144C_38600 [Actinosynnema sp. ALI-1.44]
MPALRELMDEVFPKLLEKFPRKLVYWLYGVITTYVGIVFAGAGDVLGLIMIGASILLLVAARYWGLPHIPGPLLAIGALGGFFPAFMVGKYRMSDDMPTGLILVGYVVFLVWMALFPILLDKLDEQYHLRQLPPGSGITSLPKADRDERSQYRLLVVDLWAATIIMIVVSGGDSLAALLCVFALIRQRRWTAALAAVACLLDPVLSFGYGGFELDLDVFAIAGGVFAAMVWFKAWRTPWWDRRIRAVLV